MEQKLAVFKSSCYEQWEYNMVKRYDRLKIMRIFKFSF